MVEVPAVDALYRIDPDPRRVGSSFDEQRRRDVLLAELAYYRPAGERGRPRQALLDGTAADTDFVLPTRERTTRSGEDRR